MSTPYENPPFVSDPIDGGASGVIAVDYPSRSIISAIKIIQESGDAAVFTVEIFNRDPTSLGGFPAKNFYVSSPLVANASGELLYFADVSTGGHGLTFFSQDPPPPSRIQGQQRKLYFKISPAGSGAKTYAITVTSEVQIGGE